MSRILYGNNNKRIRELREEIMSNPIEEAVEILERNYDLAEAAEDDIEAIRYASMINSLMNIVDHFAISYLDQELRRGG